MRLPVRKSIRLAGYDYSRDGRYFFTSNVKDFRRFFGEIKNGHMTINPFGKIVSQQWEWMCAHFPYVIGHAFIIMPDHLHGILEIRRELLYQVQQSMSEQPNRVVRIKPLYELIGAFKMTASKRIHLLEKELNPGIAPEFDWHRSFNDHIIRSDKAFERISRYIRENPKNWKG
jgi:putative transposase